MRLDEERNGLVRRITSLKKELEGAQFNLRCYDYKQQILEQELVPVEGRSPLVPEVDVRNVLVSDKPIKRCVFDGKKLRIASAVYGGTDLEDSAVYRCLECNQNYYAPLNKRDVRMLKKARDRQVFRES